MSRLLLLEFINIILFLLGRIRVLFKIIKFLMFFFGGFYCKFSDLKRYICYLNILLLGIYIVFFLEYVCICLLRNKVIKF